MNFTFLQRKKFQKPEEPREGVYYKQNKLKRH